MKVKPQHRSNFPRFKKTDIVDIRLPGVEVGDWEQGEIIEVRNYKSGAIYKVKTFSEQILTVEENDLRIADK